MHLEAVVSWEVEQLRGGYKFTMHKVLAQSHHVPSCNKEVLLSPWALRQESSFSENVFVLERNERIFHSDCCIFPLQYYITFSNHLTSVTAH